MDLLEQVLRICSKYSIECFGVAGTMLGAVRHNGYIPWDDDIDIGFRRKDFDIFCKVAQKELQQPYFFQYALTEKNFYEPAARISNSNTTGLITRQKRHTDSNHGIWYCQEFFANSFLSLTALTVRYRAEHFPSRMLAQRLSLTGNGQTGSIQWAVSA